jgi:hypothetical protein
MKKLLLLPVAALLTIAMCCAQSPRKVSILGDSYSTFQGYLSPDTNEIWYFAGTPDTLRTDVATVADTWWAQFIADNGYTLERNNSYSGSTICNLGYRGEDYTGRSFITRMSNLGHPDLILVFGATNDCWAKVPEGTDDSHDLFTFRPAMSLLLQSLPKLYPNADIRFILNDIIDGDIRDATIQLCERYGIECIRLKGISKRMGHPDKAGMRQISRQLTEAINSSPAKEKE